MNADKFYSNKIITAQFSLNCNISYSELYFTSRPFNNLTRSSTTTPEELATIQKQNQQRWIVQTKDPARKTRAAIAHHLFVDPTIRKSRLSMTML
jgi:hypothetical protein